MRDTKIIIYGLIALLVVGFILAFGIKSKKIKQLATALLKAQGDLSMTKTKAELDNLTMERKVINEKRKDLVAEYRSLLESYLKSK